MTKPTETNISESVQPSKISGMMDSQPRTNQMTNDLFYSIPGIGEISYFKGVSEFVLRRLVDWVDGDSSVGDCEIGYNEYMDTFTGTFTGGPTVLFDHESGFWYES